MWRILYCFILFVKAASPYAKNTTAVHGFCDLCYNVSVASG